MDAVTTLTRADTPLSVLRRDGFVVLPGYVDGAMLTDLAVAFRKRVDAPLAHSGKVGRSVDKVNVAYVDFPLTLHANATKLAIEERLVDLIERYLDTPVVLSHCTAYRTHVITDEVEREVLRKPGEFSGWHSDANVLAPNRGYRCVVAMVYLSDVDPEDGPLELVRGSHRYGGRKRPWSEDEIRQRANDVVKVVGTAGTVAVFDMESIHRAGIPRRRPRDILRFMYVPEGGYTEPLVLTNFTVPASVSERAARVLRLGRPSTIDLPLSDAPMTQAERRLVVWARQILRPVKRAIGFYR